MSDILIAVHCLFQFVETYPTVDLATRYATPPQLIPHAQFAKILITAAAGEAVVDVSALELRSICLLD